MFFKVRYLPIVFIALLMVGFLGPAEANKAESSMYSKTTCGKTALAKSECLIKAALEDIKVTYKKSGGGGITEIRAMATNVYRVSISQEERVDQITYEFELKPNGELQISKRSESTESKGR